MPPKETTKRERQVGMKVAPELYARLAKACEIQQHRDGQLARILVEWALPYYERARSVEALQATEPIIQTGRVSRDTQEVLITALKTIFERAPSAVIEEVARVLTKYAGRFGEEPEAGKRRSG